MESTSLRCEGFALRDDSLYTKDAFEHDSSSSGNSFVFVFVPRKPTFTGSNIGHLRHDR